MTTATKTRKKDIPTVSTDEFAWFTCEHGQYRVVETRFGLYKSIDKEGNDLLTALTEEGVHSCTPLHMLAHTPDYDGRYDYVMGKATPYIDL
tara:strand:+ start:235 stop:510 length:276 start_codon:yes stop_codon:yes gene_type:complete